MMRHWCAQFLGPYALPGNIIGQGIGFNMSCTGVMTFLPLLIYKSGISVQHLQFIGAGFVIDDVKSI